ncbi:MAG: DNA-binding protein [Lutibacter sp.]|nr:MAG: DNA-binding protein [Lutibacter sp.]
MLNNNNPMKTQKQLNRLQKIHQYIKVANTGSPNEFANKLNLSESQLYNILDDLKIKGFPISYSRKLNSYIYNEDCELEIIYSVKLLTRNEKIKIAGCTIKNYFTPMQLEWRKLY